MSQYTRVNSGMIDPRRMQVGFAAPSTICPCASEDTAERVVVGLGGLYSDSLTHHGASASEDLKVGHGTSTGGSAVG